MPLVFETVGFVTPLVLLPLANGVGVDISAFNPGDDWLTINQ